MRVPDWENRFSRVIAKWRGRKFSWSSDCARFAADAVIAVTDDDPLRNERGKYRTKREAMRLLFQMPIGERMDEKFPRVPLHRVQRGDIALMEGDCLGVVADGERALFFTREGMELIHRSEWEAVWAVGHE